MQCQKKTVENCLRNSRLDSKTRSSEKNRFFQAFTIEKLLFPVTPNFPSFSSLPTVANFRWDPTTTTSRSVHSFLNFKLFLIFFEYSQNTFFFLNSILPFNFLLIKTPSFAFYSSHSSHHLYQYKLTPVSWLLRLIA